MALRPLSRRLLAIAAAFTTTLGLASVAPVTAGAAEWREYSSSGRQWRETCEPYSSTVVRCRTEIYASVTTENRGRYTTRKGWAFNNLLYKQSPRANWDGNPLATPGQHTIDGRLWMTECDTTWTGRDGCRSRIWTRGPHLERGRWVMKYSWVFNNIVQFNSTDGPPASDPGPRTVITNTVRSEVQSTYRAGCPVGPSNLSTIRINQRDFDGRIHRGEIIVRRDLAPRVARAFEEIYAAGFPVAQMRNPDVWGGKDVPMMAANNTSAFNCRPVVGNPSTLSPHSRGTSIDFNPVQNPYRDPQGRWYPSNQYVKRTPVVPGMHTTTSTSVTALQDRGFEWFSGWDWHHFQYRGGGAARTMLGGGSLNDTDLTLPAGWEKQLTDGVWATSVDATIKGEDALAIGCAATTEDAPVPVAALEAYVASGDTSGVSVAMEFGSDAEARDYYAAWSGQMQACAVSTTTEFASTSDTWLGQWDVDGTTWSEAGGVRGAVVKLTLLPDETLTVTHLEEIAANF